MKPRETRPVICIILTSRSARVALRNKGRPLVVHIVSGYKHYLIRDLLSPSSIIYTLKTSSDFSVAFGGTGCSSSAGGRTGRSIL